MRRPIAIVGAPSSIGIRPYDDGSVRRLDLAPHALRARGLVERIGASDLGDVLPPEYRDVVRPPGRTRNEEGVVAYSNALAVRVEAAAQDGAFVLALGGDCSIVLGCLLGVRRAGRSPVGLVYIDAHTDFATPETSRTGSAASMCLAMAVGRGDTALARLNGADPLAHASNVVLIGRRDDADAPWNGQDLLRQLSVLDLDHATVRERGPTGIVEATLERLTRPHVNGFWVHVDADVLDPEVMPAVDSPEPGGLGLDELAAILAPLVSHPRALGLELTIYDPALDADGSSAARLAALLHRVLTDEGPVRP